MTAPILQNYDPAGVALSIGGSLMSGFEDGTFITVARNTALFNKKVSADGTNVIRTRINDRTATLTLTLQQGSPSNLILSHLATRDEARLDGVVSVSLTDVNSPDTQFISSKAYVDKPADGEYATNATGRRWTLQLVEVPMVHGGAPSVEALVTTLT